MATFDFIPRDGDLFTSSPPFIFISFFLCSGCFVAECDIKISRFYRLSVYSLLFLCKYYL